ncbi:MAG: hypothetical protein SGARI_002019, partial [Bacillariaceae sp.]
MLTAHSKTKSANKSKRVKKRTDTTPGEDVSWKPIDPKTYPDVAPFRAAPGEEHILFHVPGMSFACAGCGTLAAGDGISKHFRGTDMRHACPDFARKFAFCLKVWKKPHSKTGDLLLHCDPNDYYNSADHITDPVAFERKHGKAIQAANKKASKVIAELGVLSNIPSLKAASLKAAGAPTVDRVTISEEAATNLAATLITLDPSAQQAIVNSHTPANIAFIKSIMEKQRDISSQVAGGENTSTKPPVSKLPRAGAIQNAEIVVRLQDEIQVLDGKIKEAKYHLDRASKVLSGNAPKDRKACAKKAKVTIQTQLDRYKKSHRVKKKALAEELAKPRHEDDMFTGLGSYW